MFEKWEWNVKSLPLWIGRKWISIPFSYLTWQSNKRGRVVNSFWLNAFDPTCLLMLSYLFWGAMLYFLQEDGRLKILCHVSLLTWLFCFGSTSCLSHFSFLIKWRSHVVIQFWYILHCFCYRWTDEHQVIFSFTNIVFRFVWALMIFLYLISMWVLSIWFSFVLLFLRCIPLIVL